MQPKIPAPPGLSTSRAFTKKSRRGDMLSIGVACIFMLALSLVFDSVIGHDTGDDPFPGLSLLFLVAVTAAVLVVAVGLSPRDLVITGEGIQVPKPALKSMFRWGGTRKYSSVRKVDISRFGKSKHMKITLTFDDGYSGSLVSWDLVDAGLSKAQRGRFLDFIAGLGEGKCRKGAVTFQEEE